METNDSRWSVTAGERGGGPPAWSDSLAPPNSADGVTFGPFELDLAGQELRRRGRRVPLRPQPLQALAFLVQRAPGLVTREELKQHLWTGSYHFNADKGLNNCIRQIRLVLADNAERPLYLETLRQRGYRFIAPVEPIAASRQPVPPPAGSGAARRPSPLPGFLRRRELAIGGALAALVAAAAGAGLYIDRERAHGSSPTIERAAATPVSLLAALVDHTGEASLGETLNVAWRLGLEQRAGIQLLPESAVQQAMKRMELPPETRLSRHLGVELAQREQAQALALAEIRQVGETYLISAQLVEAVSGETLASALAEAAGKEELIPALGSLVNDLRSVLAADRPTLGAPELDKVTTSSLDALKAYSEGVAELGRQRMTSAERLLRIALELDPDFAMAEGKLGLVLMFSDRLQEAAFHMRRALRRADSLTDYEEIYLGGWIGVLENDHQRALSHFEALKTLYPGDPAAHHNHGLATFHYRNDPAAAATMLEKAVELGRLSGRVISRAALATVYLAQERAGDCLALSRQPAGELHYQSFRSLVVLHRFDEAMDLLAAVRGRPMDLSTATFREALVLADRRRFDDSLQRVRRLAELSDGAARPTHAIRGSLFALALLPATSLSTAERSATFFELAPEIEAALADSPHFVIPGQVRALVGIAAARLGEVAEAERILAALTMPEVGSPHRAHVAMLQAEVRAARGDLAGAISLLERTVLESPVFPLHLRERLGRLYGSAGRLSLATAELRWVEQRRGRSFAECLGSLTCVDLPWNVLAHGRAARRLAQASATS